MKSNCSYFICKLTSILEKYGDLEVVELEFDDESIKVGKHKIEPCVVIDPENTNNFVVIFD